MSTPAPRQDTDQAVEQMEERLDGLDKDIQHAREEQAELEHKDEGPRFVDSGDDPQDDDQTASPA